MLYIKDIKPSLLRRGEKDTGFFRVEPKDLLSNVTISFPGWGTLGTRLAMYLLCTCTHFAQRFYIRNVCTSTEERASSLLLTRKPTPFAPSCLRDTIVHYYFFTFCVSYHGDYNHRSRKYFNILFQILYIHFTPYTFSVFNLIMA